MKQDYLNNLIEVGDKNHCEATMIWFHGYGANNWSFEPSMKMINLMTDGRLHILMPNAPIVDNRDLGIRYLQWVRMVNYLKILMVLFVACLLGILEQTKRDQELPGIQY